MPNLNENKKARAELLNDVDNIIASAAMVILLRATNILSVTGFSPSSPTALSISFRLLWLFAICSFSLTQVIGFFVLYLPFSPLLIFRPKERKEYKDTRAKSLAKAHAEGTEVNSKNVSFVLLFVLITWFALFGRSPEPYALILGMALTALLFIVRVNRALYFASPIETVTKNRIEAFIQACRKYVQGMVDDFKAGKVNEVSHLRLTIYFCSWYLRISRFLSKMLRGKVARRRAALIVLVRFMLNLAILGGLSILFWALAIDYSWVPDNAGLKEALLASASRLIPGVPAPSDIHVNVGIQVAASISAWLIFVLYAGPVASLFPSFQERVIAQTIDQYNRLRSTRRVFYVLVESLRHIDQLIKDNPELEPLAKVVLLLRQQTNLREFLLGQPDYVRTLAGNPEMVELLRNLGVAIPDPDALLLEVPTPPNTDGEKMMDRPVPTV